MKKLYFLLCLAGLSAQAQTISIPDANFKARLLLASPGNTIARNLSGAYFKIDANNNGQIEVSEAQQVRYLDLNSIGGNTIASAEGLQYFVNLRNFIAPWNALTELSVATLPLLEELNIGGSQITTLDLSNNLNIVKLNITNNPISQIQINHLANLQEFTAAYCGLTSIDLSGLGQLRILGLANNQLTQLQIPVNPYLHTLTCQFNQIASLDVSALDGLLYLQCGNNFMQQLTLGNNPVLSQLKCENSSFDSLDLTGKSQLTELYAKSAGFVKLLIAGTGLQPGSLFNIESNYNLKYVCADPEMYATIQDQVVFQECFTVDSDCLSEENDPIYFPDLNLKTKLLSLDCVAMVTDQDFNPIRIDTNLDGEISILEAERVHLLTLDGLEFSNMEGLQHFTNLKRFTLSFVTLENFDATKVSAVDTLNISYSQITDLDLTPITGLTSYSGFDNPYTTLNVTGLQNLEVLQSYGGWLTELIRGELLELRELTVSDNQLTELSLAGLPQLFSLQCTSNQITELDFSAVSQTLTSVMVSYNPISEIDFSLAPNLEYAGAGGLQLESLDFSACTQLNTLELQANNQNLKSLFIKNGRPQMMLILSELPNLEYVCAEPQMVPTVELLMESENPACVVNSYCSFTPGGEFYTINGNVRFDASADGCSETDPFVPLQRLDFIGPAGESAMIADASGSYQMPLPAGDYTITPFLENPDFFAISPDTVSVTLPSETDPTAQDYCITAVGEQQDLEIAILPLDPGIPGFDVRYEIQFRNKGNTTQSGSVVVNYDEAIFDFLSSDATVTNGSGTVALAFSDLHPFQTRHFEVVLNLNAPTETPAVNSGDLLELSASVEAGTDVYPSDNHFTLSTSAVNSYDPNDKTCLEGNVISPEQVGKYVHYLIRFENTGTFPAQNIVVKDDIDGAKFDVGSLVALSGSHSFRTQITGNKVEFIFENIQLPFDDANNDGWVAFKIKTLPTLTVGDSFSNTASIYFDYNFPIVTEPATTTIQVLSVADAQNPGKFVLYPNPAASVISIKSDVTSDVTSVEVYNNLGQIVLVKTNSLDLDVSALGSGVYSVRVKSDRKISTLKFIKD